MQTTTVNLLTEALQYTYSSLNEPKPCIIQHTIRRKKNVQQTTVTAATMVSKKSVQYTRHGIEEKLQMS
jgi:hypothetical protein